LRIKIYIPTSGNLYQQKYQQKTWEVKELDGTC